MHEFLERYKYILLAAVVIAGAVFSYLFGSHAYETNKQSGFPLDDPWIHLQFAKNLYEYGSFSYYKNEMVTAGSTSPLYTILLAIGFFFTSNEMMLSYVLGVGFLVLAAFFIFKIVSELHSKDSSSGSILLGLGASLLLLLEPRMQWAALSGMETTLFMCVLLATLYFYHARQAIAFGVAAGLLVWTRPEAVILFAAIALDVIYHSLWVLSRKTKRKSDKTVPPSSAWLKTPLGIAALFSVIYAGFNLYLSGSVFPNTFAAKLKYYGAGTSANFPTHVFHFLVDGQMMLIAVFAGIGIAVVLFRAFKREQQSHLTVLLFSFGLFLAYWLKLPYLYQEGRYMMPLVPFVLMLGVFGLQTATAARKGLFKSIRPSRVLAFHTIFFLVIGTQFANASLEKRNDYAGMCLYINDRQVQTAKWLRDNTPEDAIIGTHDIGAIAYYSERKIADMVGLVSPEMIERIGSLNKLHQFLVEKNVSHIAVLRNWFEIANQQPQFQTDERDPEIMEVFLFDRQQTHFTPQEASRMIAVAGQYLYQNQFNAAMDLLGRALSVDPRNSKAHHFLGIALMMSGRFDEATREFDTALRIYPEYLDARIGLAQVAASRGDSSSAIIQLETIMNEHPEYPKVYQALADVYAKFRLDNGKERLYVQRYQELMNSKQKSTGGGK
ncbi:MAG: tetratricopeptide repeat protein [Bacteroidetes bacterium]|nr:tetratricopeptide repeat protein [Bacteroidota bacterium]MCW5894099.1 tetratricopeptide repeat protein [Bacteroidota bacterium]